MKRIKPEYYDSFSCIAGACPLTCCQEWKIAVDDGTAQSWRKLEPPEETPYHKRTLYDYTKRKDGARVIALLENHRCPFLNEEKLCRLVVKYGDTVLSDICTVFPREKHEFLTRKEQNLMPCCPAVIDLMNEREQITFVEEAVEGSRGETRDSAAETQETMLLSVRDLLIKLMEHEENTPEKNLLMIFYLLQDLDKQEASFAQIIDSYQANQTFEELSRALDAMELEVSHCFMERNELFLDLAVNYRKEKLYQEYLEVIAPYAEQLSETEEPEGILEEIKRFKVEFTKYQPLMRKFLIGELFADALMPEGDLESMLIQVEWIALEYAVLCQTLFWNWKINDEKPLTYETVRNYMAVITRMTGYEEADIYEYLENSFEDVIWDFGYFALIVGK